MYVKLHAHCQYTWGGDSHQPSKTALKTSINSLRFGFNMFRHFLAYSRRTERKTERKGSLDLHDQRQSETERGGVREREGD